MNHHCTMCETEEPGTHLLHCGGTPSPVWVCTDCARWMEAVNHTLPWHDRYVLEGPVTH